MSYWIYGRDTETGEPTDPFFSDAEDEAVARTEAESQGLLVESAELFIEDDQPVESLPVDDEDSQSTAPTRRWSLSGFVLLVFIVGSVGWCAMRIWHARAQREAVQAFEQVGGLVRYDYQIEYRGSDQDFAKASPPVPRWLRAVLGNDFFSDAVVLVFLSGGPDDESIEYVRSLPKLKTLDLSDTPITDAAIEQLKCLAELERLDLCGTRVTRKGARELQEALPKCAVLWSGDSFGRRELTRRVETRALP